MSAMPCVEQSSLSYFCLLCTYIVVGIVRMYTLVTLCGVVYVERMTLMFAGGAWLYSACRPGGGLK